MRLADLEDLSKAHGLDLHVRHAAPRGRAQATLFFPEQERSQAWLALMSAVLEDVDVRVLGTRISSGSGAIDGNLKPGYAAVLTRSMLRGAKQGWRRSHGAERLPESWAGQAVERF